MVVMKTYLLQDCYCELNVVNKVAVFLNYTAEVEALSCSWFSAENGS